MSEERIGGARTVQTGPAWHNSAIKLVMIFVMTHYQRQTIAWETSPFSMVLWYWYQVEHCYHQPFIFNLVVVINLLLSQY